MGWLVRACPETVDSTATKTKTASVSIQRLAQAPVSFFADTLFSYSAWKTQADVPLAVEPNSPQADDPALQRGKTPLLLESAFLIAIYLYLLIVTRWR